MQTLTKLQKREFELTFNFIDVYIGCSHYLKIVGKNVTMYDIRIDDKILPLELTDMINDHFEGSLKKVNEFFNGVNKENAIKFLMDYCYKHRIQPYELRAVGKFSLHTINVEESTYQQ